MRHEPELGIFLGDNGDFDVRGLEVSRQDGGEAVDGQLDGLVIAQVRLLLELLFLHSQMCQSEIPI